MEKGACLCTVSHSHWLKAFPVRTPPPAPSPGWAHGCPVGFHHAGRVGIQPGPEARLQLQLQLHVKLLGAHALRVLLGQGLYTGCDGLAEERVMILGKQDSLGKT